MNRNYNVRILEVHDGTKDLLLDMCTRKIDNNDRLYIYICTNLANDVLHEISAVLKEKYGREAVSAHIFIKTQFAYRKYRKEAQEAFENGLR